MVMGRIIKNQIRTYKGFKVKERRKSYYKHKYMKRTAVVIILFLVVLWGVY